MNGCVYRRDDCICELYSVNGYVSTCDLKNCSERNPSQLDLLRAMPDEEFIEFIANKRCPGSNYMRNCQPWSSCKECWKVWLNSPTKEVKT